MGQVLSSGSIKGDSSEAAILREFVYGEERNKLDLSKLLKRMRSWSKSQSSKIIQALAHCPIREIFLDSTQYPVDEKRLASVIHVLGESQQPYMLKLFDFAPSTQSQAAVILRCKNWFVEIEIVFRGEGEKIVVTDDFLEALQDRNKESLRTISLRGVVDSSHDQRTRFTQVVSMFETVKIYSPLFLGWPNFCVMMCQSSSVKELELHRLQLSQAISIFLSTALNIPDCSLQGLSLLSIRMDESTFIEIARAVERSASLQKFRVHKPPWNSPLLGLEAYLAFRGILARNTTLKSLTVRGVWNWPGQSHGWNWPVQEQLRFEQSSLEYLDLDENSGVGDELGIMVANELLRSGTKLREISLSSCYLGGNTLRAIATALESSLTIKEIRITRIKNVRNADVVAFLVALKNTSVEKCWLGGSIQGEDVIVTSVADLLRANKTIRSLQLHSLQGWHYWQVSHRAFHSLIEALKENWAITDLGVPVATEQRLDQIQLSSNRVFDDLDVHVTRKRVEQIQLYTTLNAKIDRAALNSKGATVEEWICALEEVNDNLDHIFILLRQNPFNCLPKNKQQKPASPPSAQKHQST